MYLCRAWHDGNICTRIANNTFCAVGILVFLSQFASLAGVVATVVLGKYIREYRDKGGLTLRKRISIILLMATMVAVSTIFFIKTLPIRIIVWVAGAIGCIVVGFVVPKAKE